MPALVPAPMPVAWLTAGRTRPANQPRGRAVPGAAAPTPARAPAPRVARTWPAGRPADRRVTSAMGSEANQITLAGEPAGLAAAPGTGVPGTAVPGTDVGELAAEDAKLVVLA